MNPSVLTVLAILAVAVVLMVTELLRADLAAFLMAITLALTGIISLQEAFSGLSHPAVITIMAIFILTQGLYRTGVTHRVGLALQRLGGNRLSGLLLVTMLGGATLSLFMNNIAAAAVLMPAMMGVARRTKISPSKLLMPLAFSVSLGGLGTFLATSNILVTATLRDLGLAGFSLVDFAPVGLPMAAVGIVYMLLIGHRLLPAVSPTERFGRTQDLRRGLTEAYALEERLNEVRISDRSPLVGKSIADSHIGENFGLNIMAVCPRDKPVCLAPAPDHVLNAEDTLLVAGRSERVQRLKDLKVEVLENNEWNGSLSTEDTMLFEIILAPRSRAAGHTLKELHFREKYELNVVAIWRRGRPYRTDVGDIPLQFGDALLVHGPRERIATLRTDPDFLVLAEPDLPPRTRKGWIAVAIMTAALAIAALKILPIAAATMLGALIMVLVGCLTMDEAYRAVEWRAIFLIAGMLPAGIALASSGAANWLGQVVVTALASWGPLALVGGLFFLAMMLSQVMSGQVTAVVLTPIAVAAAQQTGGNPYALAMAVAMGCGTVFMTPMSHPVNVFVMGPGGYRFKDFLRVGFPLTVLLFGAALILLPLVWPL